MKLMSQQQHVQQAAGTFSRPGAGFSGVSKRYFSAAPKEDDNEKDKTNASTANDDEETAKAKTKKAGSNGDSLRDAVNRAKAKDGEEIPEDSAASGDDSTNELLHKARDTASSFFGAVSQTWSELLDSGKPRSINKRIHEPVQDLADGEVPEDDDAAADKYEGSTAIMVIDEDEHLTAWERMQRRLSDAPIIQDFLCKAEVVYEKTGANKAKEKLDHIREDAQEAWETSQNPWVYRASSVYDTLTAESEFAMAVRELRQLDPEFTLEGWKHDVVEDTLPDIMKLFLEGRIKELQPWLGEAVYNRLAAEIRARKKEGVEIDTHVLGIMNSEILACEPDNVNKGSPIILLHFMCQQINCVRKKEDGSVVEGSEDDIRANSYVVAFQREYDEQAGELNWKIMDFRFNGAIAYL